MDSVNDIIVSITCGLQIVGNQFAISIDPVMGGITDAAPGNGDVSAVYGRVDIGRRSDIWGLRIAVENRGIVCVVSPVV